MEYKAKKILIKDNITMYGIENEYISMKIESENNFYEYEILQSFAKFISPFGVFYDIGANIGNHTLYFHKYFSPKKIYSFEPNIDAFNILERNVRENNFKNVQLFNIALGDTEKKVSLIRNDQNLGATEIDIDKVGEISQKELDSLDILPPDFIKIDTEGYELKILNGMKNILTQFNPVLWVEVFPNNIKNINQYLNKFNYYIVEKKEKNYIFLKAKNQEEKEMIINNFIENTIIDFDSQIENARSKYKNACLDVKEKKEYINNVNEKYRNITSQMNTYKEKIKAKEEREKELENIISRIEQQNEEFKKINEKMSCENQLKKKDQTSELREQLTRSIDHINSLEQIDHRLIVKCEEYLGIIESLTIQNQEISAKREKLIERTDELYDRNNSLVAELKSVKQNYSILRSSKLGKLTIVIWKLKKKIKKIFK